MAIEQNGVIHGSNYLIASKWKTEQFDILSNEPDIQIILFSPKVFSPLSGIGRYQEPCFFLNYSEKKCFLSLCRWCRGGRDGGLVMPAGLLNTWYVPDTLLVLYMLILSYSSSPIYKWRNWDRRDVKSLESHMLIKQWR